MNRTFAYVGTFDPNHTDNFEKMTKALKGTGLRISKMGRGPRKPFLRCYKPGLRSNWRGTPMQQRQRTLQAFLPLAWAESVAVYVRFKTFHNYWDDPRPYHPYEWQNRHIAKWAKKLARLTRSR